MDLGDAAEVVEGKGLGGVFLGPEVDVLVVGVVVPALADVVVDGSTELARSLTFTLFLSLQLGCASF